MGDKRNIGGKRRRAPATKRMKIKKMNKINAARRNGEQIPKWTPKKSNPPHRLDESNDQSSDGTGMISSDQGSNQSSQEIRSADAIFCHKTSSNLHQISVTPKNFKAQENGTKNFPYISVCHDFSYGLDHFDQVTVADDGDSLFAALANFIKLPKPASYFLLRVREMIVEFYDQCTNQALADQLGCHPSHYVRHSKMNLPYQCGGDNELLAAATLFQRSIYVFRRQAESETGFDLVQYSPMFDYRKTWDVFGVPEFPIVLICSEGNKFDAMLLQSPARLILDQPSVKLQLESINIQKGPSPYLQKLPQSHQGPSLNLQKSSHDQCYQGPSPNLQKLPHGHKGPQKLFQHHEGSSPNLQKFSQGPEGASPHRLELSESFQTAETTSNSPTSVAGAKNSQEIIFKNSRYIVQCRVFIWEFDHFNLHTVRDDGDSLFDALAHFIRSPQPITNVEIRQTITAFYYQCTNQQALAGKLGSNSAKYFRTTEMCIPYRCRADNELLAAATLFQRPIYIFRKSQSKTGYDVFQYSPMFHYKKEWSVFGDPELPIVLVCIDWSMKIFGAMLLKRPKKLVPEPTSSLIPTSGYKGPSLSHQGPSQSHQGPSQYQHQSGEGPSHTPEGPSHTPEASLQYLILVPQTFEGISHNQNPDPSLIDDLKNIIMQLSGDNQKLKAELQSEKLKNRTFSIHTKKNLEMKTELGKLKFQVEVLQKKLKEYSEIKFEAVPFGEHKVKVRPVFARAGHKTYHYVQRSKIPITMLYSRSAASRLETMQRILTDLAGGDCLEYQAAFMVKFFRRYPKLWEKFTENKELPVGHKLSPADMVDIMFDLNVSRTQFRRLRKSLQMHGILAIPSERQMKKEMVKRQHKTQMQEDMIKIREMKDGREYFLEKPCVRVPNLVQYIRETYERTLKYNMMKNHPDFGDQIWLAIGGDKGSDMTKLVFSFGNVLKPSSFNNLHILAMYQGDESDGNLRQALSIYESEWEELKSLKLQAPFASDSVENGPGTSSDEGPANPKWPIRIFLFGDLLFLSRMMGLSGSSSRSPCIFCTIKLEQLRKAKNVHTLSAPARQLGEWESSEMAMQKLGIKSRPLIPIEICDIIPPTLHIMLGIGTDLVNKIEDACYRRDLGIGNEVNVSKEYTRLCKAVVEKEEEMEDAVERYQLIKRVLDFVEMETGMKSIILDKQNTQNPVSSTFVINLQNRQDQEHINISGQPTESPKIDDQSSEILKLAIPVLQTPQKRKSSAEIGQPSAPKKRKRKNGCSALICLGEFFETTWMTCEECGCKYHLECCHKITLNKEGELTISNDDSDSVCASCQGIPMSKKSIHENLAHLCSKLEKIKDRISADFEEVKARRDQTYEVIKEKKGPSTSMLEKSLTDLGVDRQAFQRGLLVGNQIRKIITGDGPKLVTQCLDGEGDLLCQLLATLGRITDLMCAPRFLIEEEIDRLAQDCQCFGKTYEEFAGEDVSLTPKMHILLHHVPDFARQNKTVGLISEHGLESIHCRFNRFGRRFACIRNVGQRMHFIIKQHVMESTALAKMRHAGSAGKEVQKE